MIISAKLIKNPRKKRRCVGCNKKMLAEQVRMYGAAHEGEPPYLIYAHIECIGSDAEAKLNSKAGEL